MKNALFWKFLERFGVQGTQFILQIILARLLAPEHYGVLSLMVVFTTLANVFIQTGFNTALIQNKDVTEEDYSSVFWVTLGIAGLMYGIIYLAAPLIGRFYAMPELAAPLRVLALMLFPGALQSIQLAKVSREMDFKKVFFSNIGGVLTAGLTGIVLAFLDFGLWALVAQNLLNVTTVCVVMLFTVNWHPRLVFRMDRVAVLFGFGWKLLVSTLMDNLYHELRSLVMGKKFDSSTLGYFNKAKQFPTFIINTVYGAIQSVILPAMSAVQDEKAKVREIMKTSMAMSAYVIVPLMLGLAAVAAPLVQLLLSDKWLPCVPFMQLYCFEMAFNPVQICNLQALNALGRSDLFLKLEIIKKTYGVLALAAAVIFFDSPYAISVAGALIVWLDWYVNAFYIKRLLGYSCKNQMTDMLPILLLSLGMGAAVLQVGVWCDAAGMGTLCGLILRVVSGMAVYLLLSVITKPWPFRLLLEQILLIWKKRKENRS